MTRSRAKARARCCTIFHDVSSTERYHELDRQPHVDDGALAERTGNFDIAAVLENNLPGTEQAPISGGHPPTRYFKARLKDGLQVGRLHAAAVILDFDLNHGLNFLARDAYPAVPVEGVDGIAQQTGKDRSQLLMPARETWKGPQVEFQLHPILHRRRKKDGHIA